MTAVHILDGAIGTELVSRGLPLESPGWSAHAIEGAPDLLAEVHAAYASAGALYHTANTFRTQPRALGDRWRVALHAAVRIARDSVDPSMTLLGSMAPLEDCYRPDLSPGKAARSEHRAAAFELASAGCDILLCETFAHGEEALVAVEEAKGTGLPVWLSLTAGPYGDLLSPPKLAEIGRDALSLGTDRLLVNCIAATRTEAYVTAISSLDVPIGVYANAGGEEEGIGWGATGAAAADAYAGLAQRWIDAGASLVGGCCGTSPLHIEALVERFA